MEEKKEYPELHEIQADLDNTQYTFDEVISLIDQNPEYAELLKNALILAVAKQIQAKRDPDQDLQIISSWPEAVKTLNWPFVDITASLNQRVSNVGIKELEQFLSKPLTAENLDFSMASAIALTAKDKVKKVTEPDLHKKMRDLLLSKKKKNESEPE